MEKIVFVFPGNELLAKKISEKTKIVYGDFQLRNYPDGESYVRVLSEVTGKEVFILATLLRPNEIILPLYFLSKELRELGAKKITFIAPYLAYMRHDKSFNPGEALTSKYFASLISSIADQLITIDPHLHRIKSLPEIYSIPCIALSATKLISKWIKEKVKDPLLIGPDSESKQWVMEIAKNIDAPYIILEKIRRGDEDVKVSAPEIENYKNYTPIIIDDIVSTGKTIIETAGHLNKSGMNSIVCIVIHALFSGNAYDELLKTGITKIITCNTVTHHSNEIDISELIFECFRV